MSKILTVDKPSFNAQKKLAFGRFAVAPRALSAVGITIDENEFEIAASANGRGSRKVVMRSIEYVRLFELASRLANIKDLDVDTMLDALGKKFPHLSHDSRVAIIVVEFLDQTKDKTE